MPAKGKSASAIKGMLQDDHTEAINSITTELNNSIIIEKDNATKKDTHVQKQIYISQEVIAQTEMHLIKQKLETKQHTSFSAFVEEALKEKLERETK